MHVSKYFLSWQCLLKRYLIKIASMADSLSEAEKVSKVGLLWNKWQHPLHFDSIQKRQQKSTEVDFEKLFFVYFSQITFRTWPNSSTETEEFLNFRNCSENFEIGVSADYEKDGSPFGKWNLKILNSIQSFLYVKSLIEGHSHTYPFRKRWSNKNKAYTLPLLMPVSLMSTTLGTT